MTRMTGGHAVVEALIAQGVDTVFGIVSVHNLHIFDGLKDAVEAGRLRFVGARHEQAAGHMADGYARATGKPGVFVTSSGPGAADSMGAMGEAYHSSVPVLQVTTEIETEWLGQGRGVTHEAVDQLGMFKSVATFRAMPMTVEDTPNQIAAAFEHMATHHPRPSVVSVPTDVLGREGDVEIMPARSLGPILAESLAVHEAACLLRTARRLIIWVGSGALAEGAPEALVELAERLGAPVATGDGGKGAFPDDHPLALGSALYRRFWGDSPLPAYLAGCDAMLIVGSSVHFRSTLGVGLRFPGKIVQIDIDPEVFGRNYPTTVGLAGDAGRVLRQILEALGPSVAPGVPMVRKDIATLRSRMRQSVEQEFPTESRLFTALREVLNRDAILVGDPNIPAYAAQRAFPVYEPRTFFHPHGWVGIGYAFPAALGAKAGLPTRQVVCISGDGGFQYNMQELGTAVQYGIAPVVLVFNDESWGALRTLQERQMGARTFGIELTNPNFSKLGGAYGIDAVSVGSIDELCEATKVSLKRNTVQLIEVRIPDGIANLT